MIGYFMYYIIPLRKKVALINLKIAFPDKSLLELKLILKKCYIHFGMLASEFVRIPKLNKYNINDNITMNNKTKKLLNSNDPAIIMTGHIGNWEMLLPLLGYNNYYTSAIVQIQKNKTGEKKFNWSNKNDRTRKLRSPKKQEIIFLASWP